MNAAGAQQIKCNKFRKKLLIVDRYKLFSSLMC